MTERLFDKNSKIKDFRARVLSCTALDGGRFAVVLDKTAFFPNEGGQICDRGRIEQANVLSVDEKDRIITHTVDKALTVGEDVHCELDFIERFKKMQNHTAEHIVSGLIHAAFGYENVGFHLGDGYMTADFDREMSEDELARIETRANVVIASCKSVRAYYPEPSELAELEYRSKLELSENVRIVEIDGVDRCACCAPHVENTGEIGLCKIIDAIHYKGGMRLTMVAGFDALEDYRSRLSEIKQISMAISAKQSEVALGVDRLVGEMGRLKGKISSLNRELMQKKLDATECTEGDVILFEESDDMLSLRNFVNEGVKKCGGIFAVFAPDHGGFKYIIASNSQDLREMSKKLNSALDGRGGGSAKMIQGSVRAERKEIEEFFAEE